MSLSIQRSYPVLAPDQIGQIEKIRQSVPFDRPVIAFFCPTRSFRTQFGSVPELLEDDGHTVLRLYGEQADDAFEQGDHAFRVWGDMVAQMDFIDVFIVPTAMDCLPPRAKKVLFYHVSFAETTFEQTGGEEKHLPASATFEEVLAHYKHLHAFLPLFDYVAVSSPQVRAHFEDILEFYGRGPSGAEVVRVEDCSKILINLSGQRLTRKQALIPAGYPPIDCALRQAPSPGDHDKIITYAPTPLAGKPTWEPYASARTHGPQIITTLLEAFPDHQIVFKPYPNDEPELIEAITTAGGNHPRFAVANSGDHRALYDRTALLVSDFSSTAYTFALSRNRPVVFFSPQESNLPAPAREGAYCQQRRRVGEIAQTLEELVATCQRQLTRIPTEPTGAPDLLFNPGQSDTYFAENFRHILEGRLHPDWDYYEGGVIEALAADIDHLRPMEALEQTIKESPNSDTWPALEKLIPDHENRDSFAASFSRSCKLLGWHLRPTLLKVGLDRLALARKNGDDDNWYLPENCTNITALNELLRAVDIPDGVRQDLQRIWQAEPAKATNWLNLIQWLPNPIWQSIQPFFRRPLLETHAQLLRAHAREGRASVGFFCPTPAFRTHFGDLPAKLEAQGYSVLYLYGEASGGPFEQQAGSYCVGSGGIGPSQLNFLDVIATPVIMDCLPDRPRKVLIDHLSYAIFNPNKTHAGHCAMPPAPANSTNEEIAHKHTHAAAYFRLYDYHVVPSRRIMETLRERIEFFGLHNADQRHPDATRLEAALAGRRLTNLQCLIPGGYPKLDRNIRQAQQAAHKERKIVFAPTPYKTGENPEGWEQFMCGPHAAEVLFALGLALPDYKIIFKPYADESPEFIEDIMGQCAELPNVILDSCGSHYTDLYAQSALMVSDLSSTAYTFAFGTCRPVVFYSPAEDQLQAYVDQLAGDAYVESRKHVGKVASSVTELVEAVKHCLADSEAITAKITQFRANELYQVGQCTDYLAAHFDTVIRGESLPEWETPEKSWPALAPHSLVAA